MTEEQRDNFNALYDVTQTVASILDADLLLEKVLQIAMTHLNAERGFIILIDEAAKNSFNVVTMMNFSSHQAPGEIAASSSVIRKVLDTGEAVLTFDALTDDRFESSTSIIAQKILSIVCIPLRYKERVIGVVYLDSTKSRRAFTEESVKFLTIFGHLSGIALENARQFNALKDENVRLRKTTETSIAFEGLIGTSKSWISVLDLVKRVLDVDVAVLITGESGTGKELIARAIHLNGTRRSQPFVAVNCSAIPEQLLESELFGHTKGSFTGATGDKKGLVESADKGTLFLDEIGDLPALLQSKILRLLQEKEIRRVGDLRDRKVDVRIIAATNRELQEEIRQGRFREDLFFRLNVVAIHLPPLRDRIDDIPALAEYFFRKSCSTHKRDLKRIHPDAMYTLMNSRWPGNVRELQHAIERSVVLCTGIELIPSDLEIGTSGRDSGSTATGTLDDIERQYVQSTLHAMGGNRTKTAERLGVSLRWLQYKLKEWDLV